MRAVEVVDAFRVLQQRMLTSAAMHAASSAAAAESPILKASLDAKLPRGGGDAGLAPGAEEVNTTEEPSGGLQLAEAGSIDAG
jgi:hypothetical protein